MTITKETIDKKIKEIDTKLKNDNLTEEEKQVLLEKLAELEDQSEDLKFDAQSVDFNADSESEDTFIEYESVYFKYCFEECAKIDDILERLDALKQQFEQWKIEGHELTQPVDSGYCFIDKVSEFE